MKSIILIFFSYIYLFGFANTIEQDFKNSAAEKKFNGNVTEKVMDSFFKADWEKIEGEFGGKGIDGLYVKKNKAGIITEVLVSESKYNKSTLGVTADGNKQMSKNWILRNIEILIEKGDLNLKKDYEAIKKHIEHGNYRAKLFNAIPTNTNEYRLILTDIEQVGNNDIRLNKETEIIKKIDLKNPKNKEEKKTIKEINNSLKNTEKEFLENGKIKASTKRQVETKLLSKSILKTGTLSLVSSIPIVGMVAQACLDITMQEGIDKNTEDIENLKQVNEVFEKEMKLLGTEVSKNKLSINLLTNEILNINEDISDINNKVDTLVYKLEEVNARIDKNTKDIEAIKNDVESIKNSEFKTAIEQLDRYYFTKDKGDIDNSINNFMKIRNNKNITDELNLLTLNYLNIVYIERFLITSNPKDRSYIIENFNELLKTNNETIIINSYLSMGDLLKDEDFKDIKNSFKIFIEKSIDNYIQKNDFYNSLNLSNNYEKLLNEDKYTKKVLLKKTENYQNFKNKLNEKNAIFEIVNKYNNDLLFIDAVKFLYNEHYYEDALKLLKEKNITDEDFKLKAFVLIYKQIDINKFNQLKTLILDNNIYSSELKEYIKKI